MTIAKRLILLLAVPLVALVALGGFLQLELKTIEEQARFMAKLQIPSLTSIDKVAHSYAEMRIQARGYIMAPNREEAARAMKEFDSAEKEFNRDLDDYAAHWISDPRDRELFAVYRNLTREWTVGAKNAMAIWGEGKNQDAMTQIYGSLKDLADRIAQNSSDWVRHNEALAESAAEQTFAGIQIARSRWWLASAGTVLVMGWIAFVTFRRIAMPIRAMETAVGSIAAGDYAKAVPFTDATDETGGLARSIDSLKQGAAQTQALLTQTKKQESELQRINFLADTALDLSKAGYWHVPLDGSGWYNSSERAVRIYGDVPNPELRYSLADWAAQAIAGDAAAAKLTTENFAAAIAGTVPVYDTTYAYKRPIDGRVVWIHAVGHLVKDATGKAIDMYGVAQDVTDFKLAEFAMTESERKIRETEQFYRGVLELAPDGLMVVDSTGVIRLANAQCEKLFGYTREELIGHTVEKLVPDSVRGGHSAHRAGFHRAPTVRAMGTGRELNGRRKDGTLFAIEIGLSPLAARENESAQVAVSIRDISERKQQEKEIIAAKQMAEEATKAKSDFLANMSHEIRTPMNAIIGMSHLALQTQLDARQRNYIEKVSRSAENLLGIINDILDFSKIEAGRLSMEQTDFRLEDVMENLTTMVGIKAEDKGLELLFAASPDVPTALIGDPLRLSQILVNLGSNAVKFTEKGEIIVGLEVVSDASIPSGQVELHFWVKDSGIGMTPEQCGRMFQSFNQADASTTRKYGGTGLGLAICKRLVELMDGRIWVESDPGKGSTFHFRARFGLQAEPMPRRMFRADELLGVRVLVVDDNASAREILSTMARSFGLEVDAAWDGAQALEMVAAAEGKALPYDLVLMDWKMPAMDGIECMRLLQNTPVSRPPSVIMVTAYGRADALGSATERGVSLNVVLTKPVTSSTLLEAIAQALGRGVVTETRASEKSDTTADSMRKLAGARLLLVEDNELNQELALELLRNAGIEVVLANNGQEAIDQVARHPVFDGILMDCQMPVMDGYTATREIRKLPAYATLPILAMTANAMAGDREKVIEAGMNDHIAKPLNVTQMFATISKWVTPAQPTAGMASAPLANESAHGLPALPGIDTAAGLAVTMGNEKLYRKLLRKFRDTQANFAAQFSAAQTDADATAATRVAHTLRGTAGNIGAKTLQAAAAELESACQRKAPDEIKATLARALAELAPVIAGLATFGSETRPPMAAPLEIEKSRAEALLSRLEELLAQNDTKATDAADELMTAVAGTFLEPVVRKVTAAIGEYDFDVALEHARTVRTALASLPA